MILNPDYRRMLKTGFYLDKHTLRREYESVWTVTWAAGMIIMVFVLAVMLQSCTSLGGVR